MQNWPVWWEWDIELSSHLFKRMADRDFNEIDVRHMLSVAAGYRPDIVPGRWIVMTRHHHAPWEVIVEPDADAQLNGGDHRVSFRTVREAYLEVTYRHGRVLAAYLYLPRENRSKSVRTRQADPGMIVDLDACGRPLGIEITAPSQLTLAALNRLLRELGCNPVRRIDLAPLRAA